MKRLFLILLAVVTIGSVSLSAQVRADRTNSVNLSLKGLNYNMERAYGKSFTMTYGLSLGILGVEDLYIMPGLKVEPRIYYNLEKRRSNGRDVRYNSGEFFALDLDLMVPSRLMNGSFLLFSITPKWGMRRMLVDNLFIELTMGLNIFFHADEFSVYAGPGIRIGYIF